jgi:hypothetical protein
MNNILSSCLWIINLAVLASGEMWKLDDQEKLSQEQQSIETDTVSKVIRDKYRIQMESSDFNEWRSLQDWTCNAPQVVDYTISEFTETVNGKQFYRIILFGGRSADHFGWYRTTWLYYAELYSWEILDNLPLKPPAASPVHMSTICNKYVVLLLELEFQQYSTWIFWIERKEWEEISLAENNTGMSQIFKTKNYAVAVQDTLSTCHCQEAVLFIPRHFFYGLSLLGHLRCTNESGTMSFQWSNIYSEYNFTEPMRIQSTVSTASKKYVLVIVDSCVWYYDIANATWKQTSLCFSMTRYPEFYSSSLSGIEHYELVITLSMNDIKQEVTRWNLSEFRATPERIIGTVPTFKSVFFARASSSVELLVYVTEDDSCSFSEWVLRRDNALSVWYWDTKSVTTLSFPYSSDNLITSVRNNYVYRLDQPFHGLFRRRWTLSVMDLNMMRWQVIQYVYDIMPVSLSDERSITWIGDCWLIVLQHETLVIQPGNQIKRTVAPPIIDTVIRHGFTVVAVNETSALLFGGVTPHVNLWHFSINTFTWKEIIFTDKSGLIPSPRQYHAATVVGSDMYVFGGHNVSGHCLEGLWKFSSILRKWSLVKARNQSPRLSEFHECTSSAVSHARQLWVVVGCNQFSSRCKESRYQTWMYMIDLAIWESLDKDGTISLQSWTFQSLRLGFWNGYLISHTNIHKILLYMKVGCPAGFASTSIENIACNICDIGFYSNHGSKLCNKCPEGTTTKSRGSTHAANCSVCISEYCQNGHCIVVAKNSTTSPFCQCPLGFTGSRCQYATYYYISLGVTLFVIAVILSVCIIWCIRRRNKINERMLGQEIRQLKEVWEIGWGEISVQDEIGGGATGRVVLARYRDTLVAVKMLRTDDDTNDSLKFAEEIKFMQTMRHPNIILFLGAGNTPEGRPFLVLEFIRRGSLRKVLDDEDIELSDQRKIRFAIDGAKGMAFLHNLHPPRIHRDLKGENLLVSEDWVVMIADFGLGRCFRSKDRRKPRLKSWLPGRRPINKPLLEEEDLSLDGIGTARWSAPELSRKDKYDASIDVYRYKII